MRRIRHNTGEFCLFHGRNNVAKITFHISHVITRPAFCATQIMSVTFAHTYISALMNTSHLLSERTLLNSTGEDPTNVEKGFVVLRKCQGKLECLICEMLLNKDLKPCLNSRTGYSQN